MKLKKVVAAGLSVLLLQTLMEPSMQFVAFGMDESVAIDNDGISSDIMEADDENLNLDALPDDLRNRFSEELQNAVKLDESTYADLYNVVTINDDGTKSLIAFEEPIKYFDEDSNSVRFIENTIVPAAEDRAAYVNYGNDYSVSFPKNISDGVSLSVEDYSICMTPLNVSNSGEPQASSNEVVYNSIFDDSTDVHYSLENSGIKESIIVDEMTGCTCYDFILSVNGVIPETTSGTSISFLDEVSGDSVFTIQPTFIVDSYSGEYTDGENHITYNNYYTMEEQENGTYLLHMNLDEDFLNAETTVYPCVIDPSVWAVNFFSDSSSYVLQSGGSGYSGSQLSAGGFNGSGEHLSYIKATSVEKFRWIEPDRLKSANFNVKASSSGYSNSCTINCYDSTTNSDVSEVTYSELTSSLGALQSSTTFTTLGATYSFDVTELFRNWLKFELGEGGKDPAYGFILRGADNASTPGRYFSSTNSSNTYFYLVYEEGEEIDDGFYNIKNVSTGKYLRYNSGGRLSLSSYSSNSCKWQIILSKSEDGATTYGTYTLRPYSNLNVSMKGVTTGESVITSSTGNTFRIIRNEDDTFRIMPAGDSYAWVSNAIGISSNYATIQEYLNDDTMKWTFEPVVNKYFSEYSPDDYNVTSGDYPTQYRMNCYGYAFCNMLYYADYSKYTYYKQQPGEFASTSNKANRKINIISNNPTESMDNIVYNMKLDASRLGYTLTEYTPSGSTVNQYGSDSRLIAIVTGNEDYHYYMQHNDGTWSHKPGEGKVTNCSILSTSSAPVYLTNENIQSLANQGMYAGGDLKFFVITRDAIADHPHGIENSSTQSTLYYKDIAGSFMFTASTLSLSTKNACFDYYDDVDFYTFVPTSTKTYTLSTTCDSGDDIDGIIYDCNGNIITTAKNVGQINRTFNATSGKRYFIKIYNYAHNPGEYTVTIS